METPKEQLEEVNLCLEGYRTAEDGIERTHYKHRIIQSYIQLLDQLIEKADGEIQPFKVSENMELRDTWNTATQTHIDTLKKLKAEYEGLLDKELV